MRNLKNIPIHIRRFCVFFFFFPCLPFEKESCHSERSCFFTLLPIHPQVGPPQPHSLAPAHPPALPAHTVSSKCFSSKSRRGEVRLLRRTARQALLSPAERGRPGAGGPGRAPLFMPRSHRAPRADRPSPRRARGAALGAVTCPRPAPRGALC